MGVACAEIVCRSGVDVAEAHALVGKWSRDRGAVGHALLRELRLRPDLSVDLVELVCRLWGEFPGGNQPPGSNSHGIDEAEARLGLNGGDPDLPPIRPLWVEERGTREWAIDAARALRVHHGIAGCDAHGTLAGAPGASIPAALAVSTAASTRVCRDVGRFIAWMTRESGIPMGPCDGDSASTQGLAPGPLTTGGYLPVHFDTPDSVINALSTATRARIVRLTTAPWAR